MWYYAKDRNRIGPLPESALKEMFASGQLELKTLVWSAPMKEWVPASKIETFTSVFVSRPEPAPQPQKEPTPQQETTPQKEMQFQKESEPVQPQGKPQATSVEQIKIVRDDTVSQVRPVVRFWARYFDVLIFALCFGFIAGIFGFELDIPDILLGMMLIFIWIFVESALLYKWGTTPGKWLLKTTITDFEGKKPTYSRALKRSFTVWWRGLGLGIPIVTLITQVDSYNKLKKETQTPWDRDGKFVVSHKKIGARRIIVIILCFIGIFFIATLGASLK